MARPQGQVVYSATEIPEGYEPVFKPSCDVLYMASFTGILSCIEIATSLIGFICYTMSNHNSLQVYVGSGVTIAAFIISGLLLVLHMVHVVENTSDTISWYKWELGICAVFSALFIPTFLLCVLYSIRWKMGVWVAAAFFCFCALVTFIVDLVVKVKAYRTIKANNNGQPLAVPSPKAPETPTVHVNMQYEDRNTEFNYEQRQNSPKRYQPPPYFAAPPPYTASTAPRKSVDTFV